MTRTLDARPEISSREGERGVILILSMLVVLVLACVVVALFYTTTVNREITQHQKAKFPMAMAARGAFLQTQAVLIQDLEGGMGGSLDEEDGGGDGGGDMGGGGDTGGDEEEGEGDVGPGGSANTDSLVDEWARPGAIAVMTANELDVKVIIRDEDSKFNILSVAAVDEEFAEESRIRLGRLIDAFRENTRADVGRADSEMLVDSIVDWLEGDRDTDLFPKPEVKTGPQDEEPDRFEEDPILFPLTIEELKMCEGMTEDILFGFRKDGDRIPGLIEYITCYSNLVFDEIPEDEEAEEEGGVGTDGDEGDTGDDEEEEEEEVDEEDEEEAEQATETNNGRVNINTASFPVLRALVDENDVPNSVIEKILEFRDKAIELYEDLEDDDKDFSDLEEDEEEDFIFKSGTEVIERVEDYFETSFNLGNDAEEMFTSLLAVNSNVFTIYISVTQAEAKQSQNYRAVVWRRSASTEDTGMGGGDEGGVGEDVTEEDASTTDGGPEIIVLVPLELYPYPLPISEEDEEKLYEEYR